MLVTVCIHIMQACIMYIYSSVHVCVLTNVLWVCGDCSDCSPLLLPVSVVTSQWQGNCFHCITPGIMSCNSDQ